MTLFIVLAVLIMGIAILILLLPFLRTTSTSSVDQSQSNLLILQESLANLEKEFQDGLLTAEQYAVQKTEIEMRTVEEVVNVKDVKSPLQKPSRWLSFGLIIAIPLAVVGLYLILGNPAAIFVEKDPQAKQIEEMVSQLERKLKAEPTNVDGWMFLGRSYAAMNRLPEAKMAYQKAIALDPKNDYLLADLADLTAFQNKSINAEALGYLDQALLINPKNAKALALRGSAAFDQKNYAAAIKDWKLAITALDSKDQEFINGLQNSIQEAQSLMKAPVKTSTDKVALAQVSGKVSLSPQFLAKIEPTDTVFIYARASSGPRMPLAILRLTAKELPRAFELNDSLAMSPQMALSKFNEFTIVGRISKSGNAIAQPGDLIGEIERVPLGTKNISLVIDKIQP
jgi:cytochrome c-type biogenesis protein CcmH